MRLQGETHCRMTPCARTAAGQETESEVEVVDSLMQRGITQHIRQIKIGSQIAKQLSSTHIRVPFPPHHTTKRTHPNKLLIASNGSHMHSRLSLLVRPVQQHRVSFVVCARHAEGGLVYVGKDGSGAVGVVGAFAEGGQEDENCVLLFVLFGM